MPGPLPKHPSQRRRSNPTVPMVQLPAGGRQGPTPEWPLTPKSSKAETAVWVDLWKKPQAVMWERAQLERVVARYVRLEVQAEKRDCKVTILSEARQLEDRLGLNGASMMRLRWEVVEEELAEVRSLVPAARDRLRAIDNSNTDKG